MKSGKAQLPLGQTRREVLQAGGTALASAALSTKKGSCETTSNAGKPNIILFLGEGQRADALSLAGNRILRTPNHDRIGREGVWFRNSFVINALCAPALEG